MQLVMMIIPQKIIKQTLLLKVILQTVKEIFSMPQQTVSLLVLLQMMMVYRILLFILQKKMVQRSIHQNMLNMELQVTHFHFQALQLVQLL